jgi:hypothetical protein
VRVMLVWLGSCGIVAVVAVVGAGIEDVLG